jgi:hypothetical protein
MAEFVSTSAKEAKMAKAPQANIAREASNRC